jgi:hypothetical protein
MNAADMEIVRNVVRDELRREKHRGRCTGGYICINKSMSKTNREEVWVCLNSQCMGVRPVEGGQVGLVCHCCGSAMSIFYGLTQT